MSLDQYPTDDELDTIKKWEGNYSELMEYIKSLWMYANDGYWQETNHPEGGTLFSISTAGWSGNESIIGALQDNFMFWIMCWQSHRRGGHYEFQVRNIESVV